MTHGSIKLNEMNTHSLIRILISNNGIIRHVSEDQLWQLNFSNQKKNLIMAAF